jgi:predicted amidophosphoribosyltransferase
MAEEQEEMTCEQCGQPLDENGVCSGCGEPAEECTCEPAE